MNGLRPWPANISATRSLCAPSSRFPISAARTATIAGCAATTSRLSRYRARFEDLAELLIHHRPESVTDVNLQAGEDPVAIRDVAIPLIKALRRETNLGISVCLRHLERESLQGIARRRELRSTSSNLKPGARTFIPSFKRREIFGREPGTSGRWLPTIGRSVQVLFADCRAKATRNCCKVSKSPDNCRWRDAASARLFPETKRRWRRTRPADINLTLNCMAALRIMRPELVIPAVSALNLADSTGYRRGLRTGRQPGHHQHDAFADARRISSLQA